MLVTNDDALAARARYLTTQAKDDPVEYVHGAVGYNYRLTNIAAAVGVAQMEMVDEYLAIKRRIAARYTEALAGVPGITPMREAPWARSAWWMYTVLVDEAEFGLDSRALLRYLESRRIQSRPLWEPMHRSRALTGQQERQCPVADDIHARALSLPCSVGLSAEEQDRVLHVLHEAHVMGSRK
jgi:perosamine synthetase